MLLRKNRKIERAGVNAAQSFFERENWIFQPVDLGNDYGKDAYVDASEGQTVTGVCAALQIKSGASFRRASGYAISVEDHERVWRESPLPVMGIVHDPDTDQLYWCDISQFLRDHPDNLPASVPVSEKNVLNKQSLHGEFLESIRRTAAQSPFARSLLDLCSKSDDLQVASILDCLRASRADPRPLIMVRRLIGSFSGFNFMAALHMLALMTPHPDIIWGPHNRLPEGIRSAVAGTFRWTDGELMHMLSELHWAEWQRGGSGEDLYMLLLEDPDIRLKLRRVLAAVPRAGNEVARWTAMYLLIYWAREHGRDEYEQIVAEIPDVRSLPLARELESILGDVGSVVLFE
jgi:hypothetical protein